LRIDSDSEFPVLLRHYAASLGVIAQKSGNLICTSAGWKGKNKLAVDSVVVQDCAKVPERSMC
jgi:hypothetical protein